MITNYFKIAWRNLFKNKVSSFINITGLALGLASGIIIMLVVLQEFSYDKFNAHRDDIYLLMKNQQQADGISTGSSTAGPMAATFRNEIPETKYAARVTYFGNQIIKAGDKTIYESGMYADPNIFNMMSFPALQGDPVTALKDPNTVVLTEKTAKKIFGNDDPIGKLVVVDIKNTFKVGAVIKDIPTNSTIQFNMALPFSFYAQTNNWLNKWDDNRIQTWVQVKPESNIHSLNDKLTTLLQERSNDKSVSLFVYPLRRLRLYGGFHNGKPDGGGIEVIVLLVALGVFVLLLACINFMNIATARSEHRSREVGVRKVLGVSKKLIVFQFLTEAVLMTLFALVLAVILVQLVLPTFNQYRKKYCFQFWRLESMVADAGDQLVYRPCVRELSVFYNEPFYGDKSIKRQVCGWPQQCRHAQGFGDSAVCYFYLFYYSYHCNLPADKFCKKSSVGVRPGKFN